MAIEFDPVRGQYIDGVKYLSRESVRVEIDRLLRHFERESASLARQLFRREISLADFQIGMLELIKETSIISTSIGFGGLDQMTQARWGGLGAKLRQQYAYLNSFARQIEQGRIIFESQLERRSQLYSKSLRAMYYEGELAVAKAAGYTQSRRTLHALESCSECLDWSNRDWVGIEVQPPISTLRCKQFCRCTLLYR